MFTPGTGTIATVVGSRFEYIGVNQTVTAQAYRDLILSGSGNKTLGATTTLTGDLTVNATAFNITSQSLTVNGTTTVNAGGSLNFLTSTAGTKIFVGLVTVNSGGIWNNDVGEGFTFRGGITNNGSGNWIAGPAGTYAFNTTTPATQTITGEVNAPTITVAASTTNLINNGTITANTVTVTGGTVDFTNNGTLTVNVALSGTGEIIQGAGATLNIGGTSTITGFTVSAAGNTVNYTGAAQTVRAVNYQNLGLSGSGAKTLALATTSIAGNLTLADSATATAVVGLTIGGSVTLGGTATFTAGAFTHNVAGDWITNGGTFVSTGSTIVFNRAGGQIIGGLSPSNFNNLTLAGSGTKTFVQEMDAAGTLNVNSGVVADWTSITLHSANALRLAGASVPPGTWGSSISGAANQNDTFFAAATGFITIATGGFTYYSRATGNWNDAATWSTVDHSSSTNSGTFPVAGDEVVIGGGFTVTVTGTQSASTVSFSQAAALTNVLTIAGTNSLTLTGAVTIPRNSNSNTLAVGAGSMSAATLSFTNGTGAGVHQLTLSSGTVTIAGDVTGSGLSSTIQYTGAGTIRVAGAMFSAANGTLSAVAGSLFEYNGAAQTIQALGYRDLTLSGTGAKTFTTTATTVAGNLVVNGIVTNVPGLSLTVSGTTTVNSGGTLAFVTSAANTKIFTGLVTINAGGTWNNAINEGFTFQGGITNNGTWNGGTAGTYLFNNSTQTITGSVNAPTVTVTGAAIDLINNGTFTASVALGGSGEFIQGAGAILNLGGTSTTITTFTATAAGNTVNYTGAAQTVRGVNYQNLGLAGSGAKTLAVGTTSIAGNFSMNGTASATAVVGFSVGGSFTLEAGTSFTAGSFTHNVAGDWTNNGATFTATGSTFVLNGSNQVIGGSASPATFNNLTLAGTGTKTFNVPISLTATLSIATGVQANLNAFTTHTANALRLGGGPVVAGRWGSSAAVFPAPPPDNFSNDTFFVVAGTGYITVATGAFTYYSRANGAWNDAATWSTVGHGSSTNLGTFPGLTDESFIGGGFTVTVTANQATGAITFDQGAALVNQLAVNTGVSLAVTNSITLPRNGASNTLAVGAGAVTAANVNFTAGTGAGSHTVSLSSGTLTVSGNISSSGASATIQYTGAGLVQVGGTMFAAGSGTLSTAAGSRFEYTGPAQTVQALAYRDLILSGSGVKTLAGTTTLGVGGNLTINATTFNVAGFSLTVPGATTVNSGGTLSFITSVAGTKLFTGLVTINAGGTWNNAINEGFTFRGGIVNNGTFTGGTAGTYLFDTNSQSLTGTFTLPSVTVTGGAVVLTNNNTLTVNTALGGTGRITQGAGATLNIGGTSTITNMTATAAGNTVNFTAASPQTINSVPFVNLGLSGSGLKSFQAGTTSIAGNLSIGGTASATAAAGMDINGSVTIASGTTFTAGSFTHQVAGDWTNNGTFNSSGSTIVFDGGSQTIGGATNPGVFNNLTTAGTGIKTLGVQTIASDAISINAPTEIDLGGNLNQTAILVLNGVTQPVGVYDATTTPAFLDGAGNLTVGLEVFYSRAPGNWSATASWSNAGHGGGPASRIPAVADVVVIGAGNSIDVDGNYSCSSLLFDESVSASNNLTVLGSNTLTVLNTITIPRNATSNILAVGAGTVTAGNLDFPPGGSGIQRVTLSTGRLTVSGNITGNNAAATIQYTGSGLVQVGGSMFSNGTLTTVSGSRFEYNGAAQSVQALPYQNLIVSGTGTKSLTGNLNLAGTLSVNGSATFSVGANTISVAGATNVSGGSTLLIGSATGTKTFSGLVTVDGTWSVTVTEPVLFQGGITNNGTFSPGAGVQTFSANNQALNGTFTISSLTVTGIVLTNNNSLTVLGVLSVTGGTLVQATGAVLNLRGSSGIATLTATASGNTVNYEGGAQTVHTGNYFNLGLSGSGIKTLSAGTTIIAGNFTMAGSTSTTAVTGVTIGGSVSLGGTSFTAGSFTHNVAGDWNLVSGSFVNTGSTINFNGTGLQTISPAQTFNNLTISNTSLAGVSSSNSQTVNGAFVNNGRLTVPNLFLNGNVTLAASSTTTVPAFSITGGGDQDFSANGLTISNEIVVNKSAGNFNFTTPLNLSGVLSIQSATPVSSAGNLRILSTADDPVQDGAIGPVASGASITGNVTVDRFMGAEGTVNRYISSPVVGATVSQLSDDFAISPNAIRFYNESVLGAANLGYVTVNGTHVMENGRGYLAYMWNGVLDRPWDVLGTVAVGPVNLPVTHNPSSPVQINADGWNLVGNPYPCAIVWNDGPGWTRSAGIGFTISVPDIGGPVTELNWNYDDNSGDLPNGVIAMGQAFWVYSDNTTPVLQVNESAKTTTLSGAFFRTRQFEPSEQLIIRLIPEGRKEDRAFLKLNARGSDEWDAGLDAYKRPQDEHSAVSLLDRNNRPLVMHTLAKTVDEITVPVALDVVKSGTFTIHIDRSGFKSFTKNLWLVDMELGEMIEMDDSFAGYSFDVQRVGRLADRFLITSNPEVAERMARAVVVHPNPTTDLLFVKLPIRTAPVEIVDVRGVSVKSIQWRYGEPIFVSDLSAGVYLIRIQTADGIVTKRFIKQ
jgi:hypothetical protein